jgi:hypothetical protein
LDESFSGAEQIFDGNHSTGDQAITRDDNMAQREAYFSAVMSGSVQFPRT